MLAFVDHLMTQSCCHTVSHAMASICVCACVCVCVRAVCVHAASYMTVHAKKIILQAYLIVPPMQGLVAPMFISREFFFRQGISELLI